MLWVKKETVTSGKISIIIPTKNRSRDLSDTLRTILTQTVLPHEIIIVDQGGRNERQKLLADIFGSSPEDTRAKLKYLWDPTLPGLTTARNIGMAAASGDVILFLDDDVLLERNFLAELNRVYEVHTEAVGVSGVVTNYPPPALSYRIWDSIFMRGPLHDDRQPVYWAASVGKSRKPIRVSRLGGGLMSFRTDAIRSLRFDENLRGVSDGEDVDFCLRLGDKAFLFMAPAARLIHNQSPSGRERGHWLRRHARGTAYLYRRNWSRGFHNRACIAWLNIGYALVAAIASIGRLSLQPWRALLSGRREGLSAACGAVDVRRGRTSV
jgi:GT2 family glycosyltransferase